MITWAGKRVLTFAAGLVEGWCGAAAWLDRRRYARRTKAMHGPAMQKNRVSWPQRGTCGGGECMVVVFTDPGGDVREVLSCERHCDDCRTIPDGSRVPCVLHGGAFPAEMERRLAP